jgi:hypothetical protein
MTTKLVISNLAQFIKVVQQHKVILELEAWKPMLDVISKVREATKTCSCNAGPALQSQRPVFDTIIKRLEPADFIVLKTLLNVNQLCFYMVDDSGKGVLKCH